MLESGEGLVFFFKKVFLFTVLLSAFLWAENPRFPKPQPSSLMLQTQSENLILLSVHYYETASAADLVAGAVYTATLRNPFVAQISLGRVIESKLFVGVTMDYWFLARAFTVGGLSTVDTFSLAHIGPEIGYYKNSARVLWLLSVSANYPIILEVSSSNGNKYTATPVLLGYKGQLAVTLRLTGWLGFCFSGGYRFADLGILTSGGSNYLSGGATLNMSGPFVGLGLGVTI